MGVKYSQLNKSPSIKMAGDGTPVWHRLKTVYLNEHQSRLMWIRSTNWAAEKNGESGNVHVVVRLRLIEHQSVTWMTECVTWMWHLSVSFDRMTPSCFYDACSKQQTWNWVIGSPGQRVIWVISHLRDNGAPGHHSDPVWDPSFSGFRRKAQGKDSMTQWQSREVWK